MNSKAPEWLEIGGVRRSDPETSAEAAASINATERELEVYVQMKKFGLFGCISDDIVDLMPHVKEQSITPRFVKLVAKGMAEETGDTRTGKSGRQQMVRRALPPPFVPVIPSIPDHIRLLKARVAAMQREIARLEALP